jgi:hypothetical protein
VSKLASIVLVLAVSATAAPDGKIASAVKTTKPTELTDFTAWKALFLLREGAFNPFKQKDFNDTRFEYRWKSEEPSGMASFCTVEIRHAGDAEDSHTLPEIDVFYAGSRPLMHRDTARQVALGGKDGHVILRQTDCQRVEFVTWAK